MRVSIASRPTFVSLRARMTLGFAAVLGLVVLAGCIGIIGWNWHTTLSRAQQRVKVAADLLHREWEEHGPAYRFPDREEDEYRSRVALMIVDRAGNLLASRNPPLPPWPSYRREGWVVATAPFGKHIAVAGIYWRPTETALQQSAVLLLGFGVLVIATATTLAWFFAGRILQPIGALSEQAKLASNDPLHAQLVPASTDAEIRLLVQTLNTMLERLREDTLTKEQFYSAAAHELRTPLAVLSANIEVMLLRPYTAEEYQETFSDLLQQTQRLIALTESLLLLNRLRMQADQEAHELTDLTDICEPLLAMHQKTIAIRGLALMTHFKEITPVKAPLSHVQILIRNLLENAVRYATAEGRVIVVLGDYHAIPCFQVYNDCVLPEDVDLTKWFLPFYRAEASRNSATGGNGLGLAICKALADANGWELTLKREESGLWAAVFFYPAEPA